LLEQSARSLQVLAQLVHLGAGLRIFCAHLIHHFAKFADLILQVPDVVGGCSRRGGGSRCRRLLRPAVRAEQDESGCRQGGPANHNGP
jgi:hypothetical protein